MPKFTEDDFDEVDREALNRALQMVLADPDRDRAAQVRSFLEDVDQDPDHGWWCAASFASYHRQFEHLQLDPWEAPPMEIDPDQIENIIARGDQSDRLFGAAKLAKKMIAHGVSLYDPTPIDSIRRRLAEIKMIAIPEYGW